MFNCPDNYEEFLKRVNRTNGWKTSIENILLKDFQFFTKYGNIPYTMEYLNALKKIVKESISIYKLSHLDAEDVINTAINYHIPYR